MILRRKSVGIMTKGIRSSSSIDSQTKVLNPLLAKCICKKGIETSTMLVGFPAPGLSGVIAAKYIVEQLNLDVVGYIQSPLIPPISIFFEGILQYPFRIYAGKDISVFIGEVPTSLQAYYWIANAALDWGMNIAKVKEIICLGGFPVASREENPEVFLVAEPDIKERIASLQIPVLKRGYIGPDLVGAVLNETILRSIDGYALLVNTIPHFPDPFGARKLVEEISRLKKLNIDATPLTENADKIKENLQAFATRTHETMPDQEYLIGDSTLYT